MKLTSIRAQARLVWMLGAMLCTSCSYFSGQQSTSPLAGSWSDGDHNKVTFGADSVLVSPASGPATTMGPATCNGSYRLQYGRMNTAALEGSFATQPDLQRKLKQLLSNPEYPVADVTCDQGGTTYVMLDNNRMLAVYRDAGVGGTETLSRL
jgi:hypothetical protein